MLLYSTLVGGSNHDVGLGIAVDQSGTVYITGGTASPDFPISSQPLQNENKGVLNAFVSKLNPALAGSSALVYSTYLGGEATDSGEALTIDAAGHVYVTGYTSSVGFPTRNATQSSIGGGKDAFLAELDPSLSGSASLLFATYIGGVSDDEGWGLALAYDQRIAVTGYTDAPNFPLVQAYQRSPQGSRDAFVVYMRTVPQLTYHLHQETSTTPGLLMLKALGSQPPSVALLSQNLRNLPEGEYVIKEFDTKVGVPNASGVIPAGSKITFTLWVRKTGAYGDLYPRAKLYLNSPSGTHLCTATASAAFSITLTKRIISCTLAADVTVTTSDRLYLWVGLILTRGPIANAQAELDIEGTPGGDYDSKVVIPSIGTPPDISGSSPTSGGHDQ
jgi:hypothetical protein